MTAPDPTVRLFQTETEDQAKFLVRKFLLFGGYRSARYVRMALGGYLVSRFGGPSKKRAETRRLEAAQEAERNGA